MRQNNKKKNTFVAENAGGSHFFCNLHPISEKASIGEMLEWLKRHAWKACIPQKGIRGSNPRLSAINAENQQIIKQTPNFIPKNVKLGVFILFKTNHIRSENNLIKNRTNEKNNQFIFRKISYLCSK